MVEVAVLKNGPVTLRPQNSLDPVEISTLAPAGGVPVTDYNLLTNKPQINGVELIGNKRSEELGLPPLPTAAEEGKLVAVNSLGRYELMDGLHWLTTYVVTMAEPEVF